MNFLMFQVVFALISNSFIGFFIPTGEIQQEHKTLEVIFFHMSSTHFHSWFSNLNNGLEKIQLVISYLFLGGKKVLSKKISIGAERGPLREG